MELKDLQTVEAFCGTKSFSNVAEERGYMTMTLDVDSQFNPDICKSILDVSVKDLPYKPFFFWASPPCQGFSVAAIGSSWCGGHRVYCPKRVSVALGMAFVLKTIELIKLIEPKYYCIENPRGVLRKMAFMDGMHRDTVTYCQYGDTRMKPTDLWHNIEEWTPRPMCKNGMSCHISAPRGAKTGTQGLKGAIDRSRIPPELFHEIFDVIEGNHEKD